MSDQNDISMLDVSNALETIRQGGENAEHGLPQRRKSTLILTEDQDVERMHIETASAGEEQESYKQGQNQSQIQSSNQNQNQNQGQNQQNQSQSQSQVEQQGASPDAAITVPVDISWVQGGGKVYVTGSFTGWRKMISLQKQEDNTHVVTLGLPVGTHRFRFVIDNELRFSDFLPTATDQMGNFVNYVEVTPEHVQMYLNQQSKLAEEQQQKQKLEQEQEERRKQQTPKKGRSFSSRPRSDSIFKFINDDDDMGDGYSRYHDEDADLVETRTYKYISDIPPIFIDPKVMEQYYLAIDEQSKSQGAQQQAWLHPPQFPPQLDHVTLNSFNSMDRHNNSGALPIPNHVVLNHLATTSIKHNTLAVASVVRYKRKYVTQVLYAPLQQ